jgi:hypothetical protein
MNEILFYSPYFTPRLRYVCELLLSELLNLNLTMTENLVTVEQSKVPVIAYSANPLFDAHSKNIFWLPATPIAIFDKNYFSPIFERENDFFPINNHPNFTFDFLARTFYLVSRMEEYSTDLSSGTHDAQRDEHDRYPSAHSLVMRFGWLERPLVNEYAQILANALRKQFPILQVTLPKFEQQFTYDIDMAWMFRHKNMKRHVATSIKKVLQRDWHFLQTQLQVATGKMTDPYFVFDWLDALHENKSNLPLFFWLLGNYNRFDKNVSVNVPAFRQLIRRIADKYPVGLHPSYRSNDDFLQLQNEKNRLEDITEQPCTRSRQHFLKLSLPKTYRQLLDIGITDDFTMGYPDAVGFRASIATPFRWFDLERDETTTLTIHPFAAMDVTLKHYLQCNSKQAFEAIARLKKNIEQCGGTLTTLWHNSSFSPTEGWDNEWQQRYENFVLTSN